ncbi:hypothetical protein DMH04_49630 [Kibdelosporangium aridum]|uniref:Uncharacterized protein n=1 Tax=Kibdelosporangium aridum TaxID=2030 RepID=A0A428YCF9_KIBAR|nr:hypothetical protein [Kibdelosporangium aridum]RSM65239.1 hypothetical protein DMH04_49630 [Kibdelosporangium aridum]
MSDKRGAQGSRREWTRPPAPPIRYYLWQRWADMRAGKRDGKALLQPASFVPDASAGNAAQPIVDTPATRLLYELYRQAVAVEGMEQVARWSLLASERTSAIAELANASDRLHDDDQVLAEVEKGPDYERITLGEKDRPEEVHRARRQREFEEARQISRRARRDACQNLAKADAIIKQNQVSQDSLQCVSELREQRIHAHYERRAATYWRSFVQASPNEKAKELCEKFRPGLPGERMRLSAPMPSPKRATP